MYYMEAFILIIHCSYNLEQGTPFSVCGENYFLLAQTLIIILMIWNYSNEVGFGEKIGLFLFFTTFSLFTFGGFASDYWLYLVQSINFFSLISRIPQIYKNWVNKSTGTLSFSNYFLNVAGCAA